MVNAESPRLLMEKNRYPQVYYSLCRLRHNPLQAARDLYYIHVQLEEEMKIVRTDNYITRFMELFTISRFRRATLAPFCSDRQALYASLGFGTVNFLFAFPALFTIDTCSYYHFICCDRC